MVSADHAERSPKRPVRPSGASTSSRTGDAVLDLVAVMDRLRSPGGCPWDAEQTHTSLLPYLLEETYEVVDAVGSGDLAHLQEELGDLLLQVVFHARIAQDHDVAAFSIDDVARGITDKLVRRHPHVFADVVAETADDVASNWEAIKAAEKQRGSVLDGVPVSQPALGLAEAYVAKAAKVELPEVDAVGGDEALSSVSSEDQFGAWLLDVVASARSRGWDPESALRASALSYGAQVRAAERARGQGPESGTEQMP